MKKYINKISALLLITAAFETGFAQDIHFSQYSEAPVGVNPGLICSSYYTRAILGYRSQWGSVAKAYSTFGFSFEQVFKQLKLKKNYLAIGVSCYRDMAGDARLGSLMPSVALNYTTKMNRMAKFSGGLQAGAIYRTINVNNLRWDSQYDQNAYVYDPSRSSGETTPHSSITSFDVGAGVNYHYAKSERYISAQDGSKCDIGVAAYHFAIPKNSFFTTSEKLYTKYIGYINADIGIKTAGIALVPSLVYMRQGPSEEITPGFLFKYIIEDQATYTKLKKACAISFGVYYRVRDAVIPTALLQYDTWALGVAYDMNLSQLTPASKMKGGLEISLRYNTSPGYGKALGASGSKPMY